MITTEEQLLTYISLFRGRNDIYARRWEKGNKSGYSPAYSFDWNEFLRHKAQGGTINNFENKQNLPLTREVIHKHLLGKHVIGIYPLLLDNSSYFITEIKMLSFWKKYLRKETGFTRKC